MEAKVALFALFLAGAALGGCQQRTAGKSTVFIWGASETHTAIAKTAGKADFSGLLPLCGAPSPPLTTALVQGNGWRMPAALPPARVFNNLIFLGNAFSTAWAVQTDQGLILIDTQSNEAEARRDIEGGLVSLGIDPHDIRYIVISHGHGDHSGGARYLAEKYRPKIVMSRIDWEISRDPARGIQVEGWNDIPEPDILVDREYVLALGSTHLTLILTPGHTPGTLSTILPVRGDGKNHRAIIWGGTGYNFGPVRAQYLAYANAAAEMRRRVKRENIDVFLSNHVNRDHSDQKIAAVRAQTTAAANPFVLTPERVTKAFDVFEHCALTQVARLDEARQKL